MDATLRAQKNGINIVRTEVHEGIEYMFDDEGRLYLCSKQITEATGGREKVHNKGRSKDIRKPGTKSAKRSKKIAGYYRDKYGSTNSG